MNKTGYSTVTVIIAIYSTVIKYPLFHEKTRDILFFERPQGARKIKFREFSREIKGFITVEYIVLFNEADGKDTFEHIFSKRHCDYLGLRMHIKRKIWPCQKFGHLTGI